MKAGWWLTGKLYNAQQDYKPADHSRLQKTLTRKLLRSLLKMYKFFIIFSLVAVAFAQSDDEPFSIGLGVLSPSYSQTVGDENVKVNFEQKDDGFSYSVGNPLTGTNTFLNFGSAASGHLVNPAGFADANPSGYAGPSPSAYEGPSAASGYAAPQANPSYNGYAGYQAPSYGAGSYGNAPSSYSESARKPEETPSQILPAGFSYHGTDGQAFLRQDSPNFVISDEKQESARGLAEQSFHDNLRGSGQQGSGKFLINGLVGYGPGGPRGNLKVGGYAGPQFAGLVREHDGRSN